MKIATWNIRHGGGGGERGGKVAATLLAFEADILVLTEFRVGAAGHALTARLAAAGYHVSAPSTRPGVNTVLCASRAPFDHGGPLEDDLPDRRHLWAARTHGLSLVGAYLPAGRSKVAYWDAMLRACARAPRPDLFIGDVNTGTDELDRDPRGTVYTAPEYMALITAAGYRDLWRTRHPEAREYTWFSPQAGNGFRLDHAFATPELDARVVGCRYDQAARLSGASDHAAMVIEVTAA